MKHLSMPPLTQELKKRLSNPVDLDGRPISWTNPYLVMMAEGGRYAANPRHEVWGWERMRQQKEAISLAMGKYPEGFENFLVRLYRNELMFQPLGCESEDLEFVIDKMANMSHVIHRSLSGQLLREEPSEMETAMGELAAANWARRNLGYGGMDSFLSQHVPAPAAQQPADRIGQAVRRSRQLGRSHSTFPFPVAYGEISVGAQGAQQTPRSEPYVVGVDPGALDRGAVNRNGDIISAEAMQRAVMEAVARYEGIPESMLRIPEPTHELGVDPTRAMVDGASPERASIIQDLRRGIFSLSQTAGGSFFLNVAGFSFVGRASAIGRAPVDAMESIEVPPEVVERMLGPRSDAEVNQRLEIADPAVAHVFEEWIRIARDLCNHFSRQPSDFTIEWNTFRRALVILSDTSRAPSERLNRLEREVFPRPIDVIAEILRRYGSPVWALAAAVRVDPFEYPAGTNQSLRPAVGLPPRQAMGLLINHLIEVPESAI